MQFDLTSKVALVTGASSGLGHHFAQTLATHGATVVVAARRVERLTKLVEAIQAKGGRAIAVACDVTDTASIRACVEQAVAQAGGIDILVNNAGIADPAAALETTEAQWNATIDTNLNGAWHMAQQVAKTMVAAKRGGSIINIASILGLRVATALPAYVAAKAGLIHLTKALALEWARANIRVNAIAPGYILTEINQEWFASEGGQAAIKRIPQRRIGSPADLDGPLLLLASDASSYMTGSIIVADGGHAVNSL
ncbi:MAG: glucose 1-dehydrogenase [Betaproteobacteria bacterium]|nr:glucose 1-dehydrogenase [Betaproteobacteria bacterium]